MSEVDGRTLRFAHRRQELLDRATDHVAEHGLADLRLRTVAEAAGVSHRTLLHHFATKEQLLAAILRQLRDRDRALLVEQTAQLADAAPGDALALAWAHLAAPATRPYWRLFFETYGLALKDPERYAAFLDGLVADWLELIGDLLARAGVPAGRRPGLATLVLATFRGLLLDLLVTEEPARAAAALDELRALVASARSDAPRGGAPS